MNLRRPFAFQVALAAYALAGGDMTPFELRPVERQPAVQGWGHFSPCPDAHFLRRQTITRGERRRRGEVVR